MVEELFQGLGRWAVTAWPRGNPCARRRGPDIPADWSLRAVSPGDAGLIQEFVRALSPRTRSFRYFSGVAELPPDQLARTLHAGERALTLLAFAGEGARRSLIGLAEYAASGVEGECEFALVLDDWQGRGVGRWLLERLECFARRAGFTALAADALTENRPMVRLARSRGFAVGPHPDDARLLRVHKPLAAVHGVAGEGRARKLYRMLLRGARPA
ncbi:MAG: GNAT family N-acetyltransferase [Pseudomonadota bacterium]